MLLWYIAICVCTCFKSFIHKSKGEIWVYDNICGILESAGILWILKLNQSKSDKYIIILIKLSNVWQIISKNLKGNY